MLERPIITPVAEFYFLSLFKLLPGLESFMDRKVDDGFYERADAHIDLFNAQTKYAGPGKVSASMMYATARFNAWLSAYDFPDAAKMKGAREETIEYFVAQYRKMLEEHLDEYIANHAKYMATE